MRRGVECVGALGRILVVEDDPLLLRALARSLASNRVVLTAENREQALEHARREPIDLAIVDWLLGPDDGMTLIGELKTLQPSLIAVLVSALASIDVAVAAVHAGAAHVSAKPFCARTMVEALESAAPGPPPRWTPSMRQVQVEHIRRAVRDCDGNVLRAAKLLGMSRTTVYRALGRHVPRTKRGRRRDR